MLKTNVFPSSHIIDMMSAQDNSSNACPKSCWLDSNRISLLAASCPDWFPHGLYVVKLHEGGCVLHFRADGSVDTDSTVSSGNACVLGLLTASAPQFAHLRSSHKHAARFSTLISKACGFWFLTLVHQICESDCADVLAVPTNIVLVKERGTSVKPLACHTQSGHRTNTSRCRLCAGSSQFLILDKLPPSGGYSEGLPGKKDIALCFDCYRTAASYGFNGCDRNRD